MRFVVLCALIIQGLVQYEVLPVVETMFVMFLFGVRPCENFQTAVLAGRAVQRKPYRR